MRDVSSDAMRELSPAQKIEALKDFFGYTTEEARTMLIDSGDITETDEYERGKRDTERAQQAGPPGSPEREAAYREMEAQWEREGFDS